MKIWQQDQRGLISRLVLLRIFTSRLEGGNPTLTVWRSRTRKFVNKALGKRSAQFSREVLAKTRPLHPAPLLPRACPSTATYRYSSITDYRSCHLHHQPPMKSGRAFSNGTFTTEEIAVLFRHLYNQIYHQHRRRRARKHMRSGLPFLRM